MMDSKHIFCVQPGGFVTDRRILLRKARVYGLTFLKRNLENFQTLHLPLACAPRSLRPLGGGARRLNLLTVNGPLCLHSNSSRWSHRKSVCWPASKSKLTCPLQRYPDECEGWFSKKHTTSQRPDQEVQFQFQHEKVFYFLPTGSFLDTYVSFSFLFFDFYE